MDIKDDLQMLFQHPVEFILTNLSSWKDIFNRLKESFEDIVNSIKELKEKKDEVKEEEIKEKDIGEDVISYVNKILADAFIKKASDIHVEPYENILEFALEWTAV